MCIYNFKIFFFKFYINLNRILKLNFMFCRSCYLFIALIGIQLSLKLYMLVCDLSVCRVLLNELTMHPCVYQVVVCYCSHILLRQHQCFLYSFCEYTCFHNFLLFVRIISGNIIKTAAQKE